MQIQPIIESEVNVGFICSTVDNMTLSKFIWKIRHRVIPGIKYLPASRIRVCKCCLKRTLVISFSKGEEVKLCIRCRANLRYEMLAEHLRALYLEGKAILELDPRSPLRRLLYKYEGYIRSYYSDDTALRGKAREDGAVCEDITSLSFEDGSIDIMISSDVLEHVPNLHAAFAETARVLKLGGIHIFTVPTQQAAATKQRARLENGKVVHIEQPEYHSDPLSEHGILVYWDVGYDLDTYAPDNLRVHVVTDPIGFDKRVLWVAEKLG